jgi:C1A family cysteine protease
VRSLGYKRDVPDARDRLFAVHRATAAPIPEFATVDRADVAPKDQGNTSSCVGNAWAQAMRLALGSSCPELSALDVYRIARNIDGTTGDDGTFLRSGGDAIRQLGVALESAWPFDEAQVNAQPTFGARHSAYDLSGDRGYHRIADAAVADWQRALASGLPVVAGWTVSNDFVSADGRSVIGPQAGLAPAGGHAICCVGYGSSAHFSSTIPGFVPDRDYPLLLELVNSWGAAYGYNGRILVTPEFVAEATDAWAVDAAGGVA